MEIKLKKFLLRKSRVTSIKYFKYEANNYLIEERSKDKTYTSKFELDKEGNWVKKFTFKDGELETALVRDIEYY